MWVAGHVDVHCSELVRRPVLGKVVHKRDPVGLTPASYTSVLLSGTTAVASISTTAPVSMSAPTCTADIAG